jgi:serine/threonine protein kinase
MNDNEFQRLLDQSDSVPPSGIAIHVDELIATHRDSLDPGQQVDLLYLEYLARRSGGDAGIVDDVRRRHPELETEFLRQVEVDTELSRLDETTEVVPITEASTSEFLLSAKTIGEYTVMEKLGEGSQAEVFRVVHPMLRCELALKISKHRTVEADRVLDEGRLLVNVNDPGIARVIDAGTWDGHPFIVSELIRGVTLKKQVEQKALPPAQLVEFVAGLSRTIAKLHSSGIVHCDIKPTNVLFDVSGQPKLVDFGMAVDHSTEAWDADAALRSEHTGGTLAYMAPELISRAIGMERDSGRNKASRSPTCDIFSLGGLLYFVLMGRHTYASTDPSQVVEAVANGDWDRQALRNSAAPAALQRACEKAMAARPEERFQTANQFADALDSWLTRSRQNAYRRGAWIAVPLIALLSVGLFLWNRGKQAAQSPQAFATIPAARPTQRFGKLDVKVWGVDRAFELVNRVPMVSGDGLQVRAPLRSERKGELWLISSEGNAERLASFAAGDGSRWVHYPAELDESVPLTGPAGTEAIIWLELPSESNIDPNDMTDRIAKTLRPPEPWPAMGDSMVFRLVDGALSVEQDDRALGPPQEIEAPSAIVQKHLRNATRELGKEEIGVEIIAFSHSE